MRPHHRPDQHVAPSFRAQDDLFAHVNRSWLEEADIPGDRAMWSPIIELVETTEAQVLEIIDQLADDPTQAQCPEDAAKIAALFASFMDEASVEERGLAPVLPWLRSAHEIRTLPDLARFLGALERAGGTGLFETSTQTDDRDSSRWLFTITQGGLGLPDESYYRLAQFQHVREQYLAYLTRLFVLVGDKAPTVSASAVVAVETRLSAGHRARAASRDVNDSYNVLQIDELERLVPQFSWREYGQALGACEQILAHCCVRQPSYLTHLGTTLHEVPIADWRAWAVARTLRTFSRFLSSDFVDTDFDFYGRTVNGAPRLRDRWRRAVTFVETAMGQAVGREYVARHFPPTSKALIDRIAAEVVDAYRSEISRLDWMSPATRQHALDKLAALQLKVGHPDTFKDYSALHVVADDLLGNIEAVARFETDVRLARILLPVDRNEWLELPQRVNAYYNPATNEACFPAAILQPPFFSPDADLAANYAGIGTMIGHEIGHAFDDQGSHFDASGNLRDWWSHADRSAFDAKARALIDQFNGFVPRDLPDVSVNGALSVGENIADLAGLTMAQLAYQEALVKDGATTDTPDGLRRFFLHWAHCHRVTVREDLQRRQLAVSPHAPAEFRVNTVRNLDAFHAVFQTAEGDGLWLGRTERIRIW